MDASHAEYAQLFALDEMPPNSYSNACFTPHNTPAASPMANLTDNNNESLAVHDGDRSDQGDTSPANEQ